MSLFAVVRTRGAAWQEERALEAQEEWAGHAAFMNTLEKDGFVVLGGPLEGTRDFLIVIRARDQAEIVTRLAADPWTGLDLLRISQNSQWTLRLGSLE